MHLLAASLKPAAHWLQVATPLRQIVLVQFAMLHEGGCTVWHDPPLRVQPALQAPHITPVESQLAHPGITRHPGECGGAAPVMVQGCETCVGTSVLHRGLQYAMLGQIHSGERAGKWAGHAAAATSVRVRVNTAHNSSVRGFMPHKAHMIEPQPH